MKAKVFFKRLLMGAMISERRRRFLHFRGRLKRRGAPVVHYFHQVDDPYSHLAAQKLEELAARYAIRFRFHLADPPNDEEQGDSSRFTGWALEDARSIAPHYNTTLPDAIDSPDPESVAKAERYLAQYLDTSEFPAKAIETGQALWSGSFTEDGPTTDAVINGTALRHKLGHWLGATFYFEGEWYWGVDRLLHLEKRLIDMGMSRAPATICVPRPVAETVSGASNIQLEYFPSLRSPYTAISYDRTMDMVKRTGVDLKLRPVMPMMMRGIPAPRSKQLYIMADTKREADYYQQDFGPIIDPFGEPVKRAFSLLPFMTEQNKAVEFCSEYLNAAWTRAVDITEEPGLRQVVEAIGCNWEDASSSMNNPDWQNILEDNVSDMLELGLWGVPSFRVSGGDKPAFSCWGQDRLWLVESDIASRAK